MLEDLINKLENEKEKADNNYCNATSYDDGLYHSGVSGGLVFAIDRLKDFRDDLLRTTAV